MQRATITRKGPCGRIRRVQVDLPFWIAEDYVPHPARRPTDIPPGTRGRIELYASRVRLGQEVFHPLDAGYLTDLDEPCSPIPSSQSPITRSAS